MFEVFQASALRNVRLDGNVIKDNSKDGRPGRNNTFIHGGSMRSKLSNSINLAFAHRHSREYMETRTVKAQKEFPFASIHSREY